MHPGVRGQAAALLAWLLLAIFIVGGAACDNNKDDGGADDDSAAEAEEAKDKEQEEEARIVPVRVAPLERQGLESVITAASTVESERAADVFIEVAGIVSKISAEEGDVVQTGTVLAKLRSATLQAQASTATEENQQAESDLKSLSKVHDGGFLSDKEYQTARLRVEQSRAALASATESLGKGTLKSPIAGTVVKRELRYGEAVSPGRPAFQIMDLDRLLIDVRVPERDLPQLKKGQTARIVSELQGGVEVEGKVERIAPVVDPLSGTVKVTIALPKGDRTLRPGSFVQVSIVTNIRQDVPVVPKKALTLRGGKKHLYVVRDNKAVELVPTLGLDGGDVVEILEKGPVDGDLVVIVGQETLEEGTEVRIVSDEPESPAPDQTEPSGDGS